jgi:hypothetical protein
MLVLIISIEQTEKKWNLGQVEQNHPGGTNEVQ